MNNGDGMSKKVFFLCIYILFFSACGTNRQSEYSAEQSENESFETQALLITEPEKNQDTEITEENIAEAVEEPLINTDGQMITERFPVPQGFTRLESETESFAYYLQNLPLKPDGTKVKYYDGREKLRDVYLAVVDFSLGDRDLQQCADAVIRLRAEYLYAGNRYDEINFHFVSGFYAEFSRWADGNGISVNGNTVTWTSNGNNNSSYESFQKYLDMVYAYASTLSLEKELDAKPFSDLAVGDVFIQGGSPGHCVIVVDAALNENTGEKIFMLAQSYMPAQDIQILQGDNEGSPWFSANIEDILDTPEWTFKVTDLKTWQ